MPRNKRSKRNRAQSSSDVEICSGYFTTIVTTVITASTQATIQLAPNNFGSRLSTLNDLFRFYRFTRVGVKFLFDSDGDDPGIVGFLPGVATTVPVSIAEVTQCDRVGVALSQQATPVHLQLSSKILTGMTPWYYTRAGASAAEMEVQGTFVISTYDRATGAATASNLFLAFTWTCELKGRIPAAVSIPRLVPEPARVKRKLVSKPEDSDTAFEHLGIEDLTVDAKTP